MNPTEANQATQERAQRGVLCAKCEHLNKWGRTECSRCRAHLYVTCGDCGQRNERVRSRCESCGRRLHKGLVQRCREKVFGANRMAAMRVVLFVLGVALAFGAIVFIANLSPPPPEY